MVGKGLLRTDYFVRNGDVTVRARDTRCVESVTDVESFLLPYGQAAGTGLHLWGIADGLSITGSKGQPGLNISLGCAIDAAGHLIVLTAGGWAVVDPGI